MYERQLLKELEALRVDVSNANKRALPVANGVPKPTIVPPLEDHPQRPAMDSLPSAPVANGFPRPASSTMRPPHTAGIPSQNGFVPHKVPQPSTNMFHTPFHTPPPTPFQQNHAIRQDPLSAVPARSFTPPQTQQPISPLVAQQFARQPLPPQSPGAGPSSPVLPPSQNPAASPQVVNEPPLGGRFVDGTKSMFVPKTSNMANRPSPLSFSSSASNIQQGPNTAPGAPFDPLRSDSYPSQQIIAHGPATSGPHQQQYPQQQQQQTDPLGNFMPRQMSASVRVQPTRPRLDAREAASKLANMF